MRSKWFLVVIAAAIVFSGPMIAGYAVIDELALYILLLFGVFKLWPGSFPRDPLVLARVHRLVFLTFCVFLVAESVRGGFVLHDIRMIRFVAMFGGLAFLAILAPVELPGPIRSARVIAWAGVIYMLAYIGIGIFNEWVLNAWRFDTQGYTWSGTTAAVFPLIGVAPTLIALAGQPEKRDRRLFWIGFLLLLFTGFYYQSRLTWLTIVVTFLGGAITLGARRATVALALWLGFVVFFPWIPVGLLTPSKFAQIVTHDIPNISLAEIKSDVVQYRVSVIGGSSGLPPQLTEQERVLSDPKHEAEVKQRLAAISANLATADPAKAAELRKLLDALEAERKQIEDIRARVAGNRDVDRKLALLAAVHFWTHNGVKNFLIGTGYYTHRFILPITLQEISDEYGFEFPERFKQIVRTAIFNGMLVDNGLIGMGLFALLFALTGLQIVLASGLRGLFRSGPALTALGSLGLMAIALNVGAIYDSLPLYIALMSGGTLTLLTQTGLHDQG